MYRRGKDEAVAGLCLPGVKWYTSQTCGKHQYCVAVRIKDRKLSPMQTQARNTLKADGGWVG